VRIGIDLDSCVYPFPEVFRSYAGLEARPARQWNFFEDDGYTEPQFLAVFEEGVDAGYIFAVGDPIVGSVEALQDLRRQGHTIHIVTDRFVGKLSHANTEAWLARWGIEYNSLTYTRDKTILRLDAAIDDKPEHVNRLRLAGCHAYLLDRGRTDQVGHSRLVEDWPAFVREVGRIGFN
jgi:hypothetical protein